MTPETRPLVRREIMQVLSDLPEVCASRLNTTGQPVLLKRGTVGYWPTRHTLNVEQFNHRHGITAAQVAAMECGSMCGFEAPGADPLNYPDLADAWSFPSDLVLKWREAIADGSWMSAYARGNLETA